MSARSGDNCRIKYHQGTEEQQKMVSDFCRLKDAPVGWGGFFLWEDKYREASGLHLQFVCIMFSAPTLTGSTEILGTA